MLAVPQVDRWRLQNPPFSGHAWDRCNQEVVLWLERQWQQQTTNSISRAETLLDQLKWMRVVEERVITLARLDVASATTFMGTCIDMCPPIERIHRAAHRQVQPWEIDSSTGLIGRYTAVKTMPVIDNSAPLPLDVRPPWVLKLTMDYLVDNVARFLPSSYRYLWDAFGTIMQDFAWQKVYSSDTVYCSERVLRFHLWLMHHMLPVTTPASRHREFSLFRRRLHLLSRVYWQMADDEGNAAINPEFYGYYLLTNLDAWVDDEVMLAPETVLAHDYVQLALELRWFVALHIVDPTTELGIAVDTYRWFFDTVYSLRVPALAACLLEAYFDAIRYHGLRSMASVAASSSSSSSNRVAVSDIANILGFADNADARMFILNYGLEVVHGEHRRMEVVLDVDHITSLRPRHSRHPAAKITAKFDGMTPPQVLRPPAVIASPTSEDLDSDLYHRWLREWCRPDPQTHEIADPSSTATDQPRQSMSQSRSMSQPRSMSQR